MSNEFDLDEYISNQVEQLSVKAPDPEKFIRTLDNIRQWTGVSALIPGAESAVVLGGGLGGFFAHDGTIFPVGHALSIVIDTNEEAHGLYIWACVSTSMVHINDEFLRSVEDDCMGRMKAIEHPDCDDPAKSVLVVQEVTAKGLLKKADGDIDLSMKEQRVMANRLLDTMVHRMSADELFCKIWDEAATGGMTLSMLTLFIDGKIITSMIPLGKSMPFALAKEVYGEDEAA